MCQQRLPPPCPLSRGPCAEGRGQGPGNPHFSPLFWPARGPWCLRTWGHAAGAGASRALRPSQGTRPTRQPLLGSAGVPLLSAVSPACSGDPLAVPRRCLNPPAREGHVGRGTSRGCAGTWVLEGRQVLMALEGAAGASARHGHNPAFLISGPVPGCWWLPPPCTHGWVLCPLPPPLSPLSPPLPSPPSPPPPWPLLPSGPPTVPMATSCRCWILPATPPPLMRGTEPAPGRPPVPPRRVRALPPHPRAGVHPLLLSHCGCSPLAPGAESRVGATRPPPRGAVGCAEPVPPQGGFLGGPALRQALHWP